MMTSDDDDGDDDVMIEKASTFESTVWCPQPK